MSSIPEEEKVIALGENPRGTLLKRLEAQEELKNLREAFYVKAVVLIESLNLLALTPSARRIVEELRQTRAQIIKAEKQYFDLLNKKP